MDGAEPRGVGATRVVLVGVFVRSVVLTWSLRRSVALCYHTPPHTFSAPTWHKPGVVAHHQRPGRALVAPLAGASPTERSTKRFSYQKFKFWATNPVVAKRSRNCGASGLHHTTWGLPPPATVHTRPLTKFGPLARASRCSSSALHASIFDPKWPFSENAQKRLETAV